MNYISTSDFRIGAGFGAGRQFTVGQKVSEKFYARLATSLKRHFTEANAKKRELYTEDEKLMAIELYLDQHNATGTVDYEAAFAEFHATFPERSFNSLKKLLYAIQSRDTFCPQVGLTSVAKDVAEALHAYDAERFPLTVDQPRKVEALIDSLLGQIRAEG